MPHKQTLPLGTCICRNPDCKIPYRNCHCGCGKTTFIAVQSDTKSGYVIGYPKPYCQGHGKRSITAKEDALPFKMNGVYCRLVPLTKGQWAIVWACHYDKVMERKWVALWCKHTQSFYAVRTVKTASGKKTLLSMHRFLLGLEEGNLTKGDHANNVTLDNRYDNLRPASNPENAQNARLAKNNTSGRKGVSWNKKALKYRSRIQANSVTYHLGDYSDFEDACRAREEGEIKYHGKYARSR